LVLLGSIVESRAIVTQATHVPLRVPDKLQRRENETSHHEDGKGQFTLPLSTEVPHRDAALYRLLLMVVVQAPSFALPDGDLSSFSLAEIEETSFCFTRPFSSQETEE
jgi:hypothetical protein